MRDVAPSESAQPGAAPEATPNTTREPVRLTPEQLAARKRRNLALGLALVGFIAVIFISTIIRLQANLAGG